MIIWKMIILKLLLMLDVWFGVLDINKQIINLCSMASNKVVEMLYAKRRKKKKKKEIESFLIDQK